MVSNVCQKNDSHDISSLISPENNERFYKNPALQSSMAFKELEMLTIYKQNSGNNVFFSIISDSPGGSRPLSRISHLSRASGRIRTPLDAVTAANLAESHRSSPAMSSRSLRSARSVVILESTTELRSKSKTSDRSIRKSDKL